MQNEAITPTAEELQLVSRGKYSPKQIEVSDKFIPWLKWITYLASGRKVAYLRFSRNNERYSIRLGSLDEASATVIRNTARRLSAECDR